MVVVSFRIATILILILNRGWDNWFNVDPKSFYCDASPRILTAAFCALEIFLLSSIHSSWRIASRLFTCLAVHEKRSVRICRAHGCYRSIHFLIRICVRIVLGIASAAERTDVLPNGCVIHLSRNLLSTTSVWLVAVERNCESVSLYDSNTTAASRTEYTSMAVVCLIKYSCFTVRRTPLYCINRQDVWAFALRTIAPNGHVPFGHVPPPPYK